MNRDDATLLAGEYVLGLLSEADSAAIQRQAETDPTLAGAIAFWQARLDPLTDTMSPVAPTPLLWARIEADTQARAAPAADASKRQPWRPLALASLLLAACLAAFIGWSHLAAPAPTTAFQAEALLTAPGSILPSARVQILRGGDIVVVPLRKLDIPEGRQMDLWAWPREEKAPVLLGPVASQGGAQPFPYPAREGTPVMITSEPAGAGTPAAPGPTLYAGLLLVAR